VDSSLTRCAALAQRPSVKSVMEQSLLKGFPVQPKIVSNRNEMSVRVSAQRLATLGRRGARYLLVVSLICGGFGLFLDGMRIACAQELFTLPSSRSQPSETLPTGPLANDSVTGDAIPTQDVTHEAMPLDGSDGRQLSLGYFRPRSQLVIPQTNVHAAKFPVIDVHTHFALRMHDNDVALNDFVDVMNRNRIAICVSLDGTIPTKAENHHRFLSDRYPNRFAVLGNLDLVGDGKPNDPATWACHRPGFADRMASAISDAAAKGWIVGLKVFKSFGLVDRNPDGTLIKVDDPKFDPIWDRCGQLGLPVLIHTADPAAFFLPIDPTNERWEELSRHPDWSFAGADYPSLDELMAARNRLVARHRQTIFIGAHMASSSENLGQLSTWLKQYPNLQVDIASRISELGRQDHFSREFLTEHQDRVLFGTDGPWPEKRLHAYWRFLETKDESFDYSEKMPPPQGFWQIDGVGLDNDVLRKIYHDNALKWMPSLRAKFEAARLEMQSIAAEKKSQ
jgi:predicted TIM-barrel fold metal-dependent hydrolase